MHTKWQISCVCLYPFQIFYALATRSFTIFVAKLVQCAVRSYWSTCDFPWTGIHKGHAAIQGALTFHLLLQFSQLGHVHAAHATHAAHAQAAQALIAPAKTTAHEHNAGQKGEHAPSGVACSTARLIAQNNVCNCVCMCVRARAGGCSDSVHQDSLIAHPGVWRECG